jgi:N,N-dimethylformamidase beta subunit-like, C-terminal
MLLHQTSILKTRLDWISGGICMRLQLSRGNVLFLGSVGVALLALLFTLVLRPFPHSRIPATPISYIIQNENTHPGTNGWQIPYDKGAITQIQAYAGATSVSPGQKLAFYVSTRKEGMLYSISIYRLGWYGGLGGRLMSLQANQIGHAQGHYNPRTKHLVGCNSCHVDTRTGLVEAHWQPSYTLTVPSDWATGVYLAKFTDANDMQTYAPFDVRGNTHSTYIVVTSDTTYAAYNNWGGYSLYGYNSLHTNSLGMGVKVSFDRPYTQGYGSGDMLRFEADAIHWFERQGYDVSYISSVDLHADPAQLLQHRAYLSIGHDEYWTKEMRDGVEYARDHGVGLAFLEADAAYWQMRFEPDSAGVPNRTIVCYKVDTSNHDLTRDPLYGKDNTRVTALWRDPVLNRPENALIGIMFSNLNQQSDFPWQLSSQAKSPFLDGTGLQPGQEYGCGLVGYEWDRVFANGATPAGLHVLSVSHTVYGNNHPDVSNTTYYTASSGAMVFATGSIYWARSLDSYSLYGDKMCGAQSTVIPAMQNLMAHIMNALVINPG